MLGIGGNGLAMEDTFLGHIKKQIRKYKPFVGHAVRIIVDGKVRLLASELGNVLRDISWYDSRFVSLQPEKGSRGNVLLSYINDPFFLKADQPISHDHTHDWESFQIARTFLELGYSVDVIRYQHLKFVPRKDYSFLIDARKNLERLAPLLNSDCVKIMHAETAHWLFHNAAQHGRLQDLQHRKGITLPPWKTVDPNWAIEHADCAIVLGNKFTISTFRYANKPIFRVPISTPFLYAWREDKDFEACRRRFLWFGSAGLVHKGLDLVLDAFAEMPEYHLTICGPIDGEKHFEKAFQKELYQTANIHTVGWVDIRSPEFLEITKNCIGLLYPSCSEGGGGSVVTCLHAGLIPIVSYESSVDVDEFGIVLTACSMEEIKNSIRTLSGLPSQVLRLMARKAWGFARANHTRERFAEKYRQVIAQIIASHKPRGGAVGEESMVGLQGES